MRRLSRREFLASGAASIAVAASGCSGSTPLTPALTVASELRVVNWSEYVDPDLLTAVETALSAGTLSYSESWVDNYSGADELGADFGLEGRPAVDLVAPTNWLAAQWIKEGRIDRLPLHLIPNHANIDPIFLTNSWDRGARFHMPWQSGITGIAYNRDLVDEPITSFDQLFDPTLAGRVSMIGEMREAVGLRMLANGDDPSRPTLAAANRAFAQLESATASGQFHSWGFNEFADLLETKQTVAAMAWSGDVVQLQQRADNIEFVIPDEGAIQWFDTMVIPRGAANVRDAATFLNFFYDPSIAARQTAWVQYISPVVGVREELLKLGGADAALASNPILFPDDATRAQLAVWGGLDSTADEADLDDRFADMAGL